MDTFLKAYLDYTDWLSRQMVASVAEKGEDKDGGSVAGENIKLQHLTKVS